MLQPGAPEEFPANINNRLPPGGFRITAFAPSGVTLSMTAGMTLGLMIDLYRLNAFEFAAFCGASPPTFRALSLFHFQLFPCMHIFMLVGGILNLARPPSKALTRPAKGEPRFTTAGLFPRLCFNTACNLFMLAGMMGGGWMGHALTPLTAAENSLPMMIFWMFSGMLAGAAANGLMCRLLRLYLNGRRGKVQKIKAPKIKAQKISGVQRLPPIAY